MSDEHSPAANDEASTPPAATEAALARVQAAVATSLAARTAVQEADNALDLLLWPAVRDWHEVKRVPCGHTGGWSLNDTDEQGPVTEDGNSIRLIHQCRTAHRYDLDHSYETRVPVATLVDRLPATD